MDLQHISSSPHDVLDRAVTSLPFLSLVMETLSMLIKEANFWGGVEMYKKFKSSFYHSPLVCG